MEAKENSRSEDISMSPLRKRLLTVFLVREFAGATRNWVLVTFEDVAKKAISFGKDRLCVLTWVLRDFDSDV